MDCYDVITQHSDIIKDFDSTKQDYDVAVQHYDEITDHSQSKNAAL